MLSPDFLRFAVAYENKSVVWGPTCAKQAGLLGPRCHVCNCDPGGVWNVFVAEPPGDVGCRVPPYPSRQRLCDLQLLAKVFIQSARKPLRVPASDRRLDAF